MKHLLPLIGPPTAKFLCLIYKTKRHNTLYINDFLTLFLITMHHLRPGPAVRPGSGPANLSTSELNCSISDQRYLDLPLSFDLDLDLSRDLERSPPRPRDLLWDLDLERECLFSSVSLILRPSNSVPSSLSNAYSMSDLDPNSTIPSPLLI